MEEELIPLQMEKGIVVVGSFVNEQDEDEYVWIRRFDSEEERVRLYEAFYGNDHWKNVMLPRVKELIELEQIQTKRLQPTPRSVIR